ncbi:pleiotropic drug resistance ABC transporter [Fistulina hepatica ATCC 64428]|uniref:Pleiotropic drug resistance ABC transporter n=1 Tax=Fistulina hepatica ATCC 64428 TaxID=1128425 RepID=A0A0D7A964_9AGAR|nr:pleiotropic drug resistance ABC transporter [Fistulina hepatica ATCC 64428]
MQSEVAIGYFDPNGVNELRRAITNLSTARRSSIGDVTLGNDNVDGDGDKSAPFDFEQTLRTVMRMREEADIASRELGVVFDHLSVTGIGASAAYQPTLGSLLNPLNIAEKVRNARHTPTRTILDGFHGSVRPGEMLLVLGRPGAGCTTLLKTLANETGSYHSTSGTRAYVPSGGGGALLPPEIAKHFRGDVLYCPEDDVHFPSLTVAQTVRFAARCRAPQGADARVGREANLTLGASRDTYANLVTDILLTVFGLRAVKDTVVGDHLLHGISGGQKKRVSITEVMAARACIACWDNSTRGLDSSTALEFVHAVRLATDLVHMTSIVSLYQAGENLYKLFDKAGFTTALFHTVCLIYEGKLAYFGPASEARQYFINLGYEPAHRQTTADFLVAVTDPNGRIPRAVESGTAFLSETDGSDGVTHPVPRTAQEFADYFSASEICRRSREDVRAHMAEAGSQGKGVNAYRHSARIEHARHTRVTSPYLLSVPMQARAVMVRRVQILRGNLLATVLNTMTFLVQGIIVGTVYFQSPQTTAAYFSRGGVLFFSLLFSALSTMAEIPALFSQRPIVLRHRNWAFYHPFIDSVSLSLVDLPITFVNTTIWGILLYFLVGLQQTAGQFFIFFLFLFIVNVTMKSWFRGLAAAFDAEATAQTLAGISVLAFVLYTGYTIPQPSMIGALKWLTWLNPLRYGFEAIVSNEFHTLDGTCANLVPEGTGYENISLSNQVCTTVGSVAGQDTVDGNRFIALSFGYSYSHVWRNLGIIIAFGIAFTTALLAFTEAKTKVSAAASMTLYKRETSTSTEAGSTPEKQGGATPAPDSKALQAAPAMHDVFTFQHINYSVPAPGSARHSQQLQLLNDVSGYVAPGKLTALMGESGAGKTTLLNVLAQRVDVGVVTGEMFVKGQALPADFQAQTGYCQQLDTHLSTSTIRESLLFSANLRQPASVPLAEKEAYVDTVLAMCGLTEFADMIIGTAGVEIRKRTTIGVELAAKPKLLLFLDEPTSGLDSQSAWSIVTFLRSLADNGQAILCTIHQPSSELFQTFDRLLLLRKGGETVYFGDLGHNAETLISYFERNGASPIPEGANSAEWMLDVIGAGATAEVAENWYEIWQHSSEATTLENDIQRIHAEGRRGDCIKTAQKTQFATPWWYQAKELIKREAAFHYRDPTYLMAKLVLNIVAGLFIGFTFFKAKDSQQGTQNKLFAMFMSTIISVPLAQQLQSIFLDMRSVYEIRERPSRMYSWTALVTSQIFVEIPWNMLGSTLYFLCWYWTVGYPTSRAGYQYLMMGILFPWYYTTVSQSVAAMSPNKEIASILFSFLFSFVLTFNGIVQPYRRLGWWQWMYRLSPYTYVLEGWFTNAVGHTDITCSSVEYVSLNPPSGETCGQYMDTYINTHGGYLTNADATSDCQFCSTRTTDQFYQTNFNMFYSHHWRNVGLTCAYIVFNIFVVFAFTWFFRIRTTSLVGAVRRILPRRRH